jgi:hypothetical protein
VHEALRYYCTRRHLTTYDDVQAGGLGAFPRDHIAFTRKHNVSIPSLANTRRRARQICREHTSAYVSTRQHTSPANKHTLRQHTFTGKHAAEGQTDLARRSRRAAPEDRTRTHHMPVESIHQHTLAYVSIRRSRRAAPEDRTRTHHMPVESIRQHTSEYVSLRRSRRAAPEDRTRNHHMLAEKTLELLVYEASSY